MEKIFGYILHVGERFSAILHTVQGWIAALVLLIADYIAGHEFAVCLVVAITIMDAVWGLPCQIAAYTFILAILDIYGFKEYSINGETTRVTSEWTAGKSIPSPHGDPVGSTDANCLLAQKCAIMAIKNPFEVTDMSYIINPTYK